MKKHERLSSDRLPLIFHSDITPDEIVANYGLIADLMTDYHETGKTSWPCIQDASGEKFTVTKADIETFMATALALHRAFASQGCVVSAVTR